MVKNTQRDRVWIAALREDEFTKHDIIDSVDAGSRTVHDVLKTMVDADLLTETNDRRRVDRGDSYMYTDVTVYTSDGADENDSSTTDAHKPDTSDIDNGEINRVKEEIGVSNGDVPVQPHGSTDEKPDTPASNMGETVESDSNSESDEYICIVCGDSFENNRALTAHATHSNNHQRVSQMDSCPECGKETILDVKRLYEGEDAMISVTHEAEVNEYHGMKMRTVTDSCTINDGYEV
jgi:DNA-directed RNA polymerase subunit RPC12/RpoP